ncbi:signal peptidase I [Rariglobus hedericola]|uniref:signal peptidase I n=1 Tax=Rariglobus hedericola TaxID=2597822 RepID=UPI001396836D|nr:signal peptidase I [Rariglobus hedericola]
MKPAARHRVRTGLRVVERFFAIVGVCALIYHLFFDFGVMVSSSMSPALQGDNALTGDRVIFEKWTGLFRAPQRWEIHQFHTPEGLTVAKRVIGLPGERVSLRKGLLCINGSPVAVPERLKHLRYLPSGNLSKDREVECGTGYYVLGDDSRDSWDSRYEGVLAADRFTGRAWLILGPRSHWGFVR